MALSSWSKFRARVFGSPDAPRHADTMHDGCVAVKVEDFTRGRVKSIRNRSASIESSQLRKSVIDQGRKSFNVGNMPSTPNEFPYAFNDTSSPRLVAAESSPLPSSISPSIQSDSLTVHYDYASASPSNIFNIFQDSKSTDEPRHKNDDEFSHYAPPHDQTITTQPTPLSDTLHYHTSFRDRLLQDGFIDSQFSDISIKILGEVFKLHRLILHQSDFFQPILALHSSKVAIKCSDQNVSIEGIRFVLSILYVGGHSLLHRITIENVLSILASALFLSVPFIVPHCLKVIESFISPSSVNAVILFIESSNYGAVTSTVEDLCLRFLCSDGFEHQIVMKEIPLLWYFRVLEADPFWCPDEFSRYKLAQNVLKSRTNLSLENSIALQDMFKFGIIYTHMKVLPPHYLAYDALVVFGFGTRPFR